MAEALRWQRKYVERCSSIRHPLKTRDVFLLVTMCTVRKYNMEYAREKKPVGNRAPLYLPFVPEQILALPHATHPACTLGYMLNANIYYQSN